MGESVHTHLYPSCAMSAWCPACLVVTPGPMAPVGGEPREGRGQGGCRESSQMVLSHLDVSCFQDGSVLV